MRELMRQEIVELAVRVASPNRRVSIHGLAEAYGVSDRWVRELRRRYRVRLPLPDLARLGRLPRPISPEERAFILRRENEERLNPVALEKAIERRHGIHIPHNRLWRVLKAAGHVADSPPKRKRRAWVCFERRFANSVWQVDYTVLGRGAHLLMILDDASRLIVGYAVTGRPRAEFA